MRLGLVGIGVPSSSKDWVGGGREEGGSEGGLPQGRAEQAVDTEAPETWGGVGELEELLLPPVNVAAGRPLKKG